MKKLTYLAFLAAVLFFTSSCVTAVRPVHAHHKTVIVKNAPKNHKVVYVKGKKYFHWGGKRYRRTNKGYVVVRL